MIVVYAVAFVVVAGSALTAVLLARRHAWRWGEIPGPAVAAGEGAYRGAVLATSVPRGTPALVPWAAGTGFVWAAITFFVFAPAGLLLALIVADDVAGLAALWVVGVSASGFGLAVMLVVAGVQLLRCRPGAHRRARRVATWSIGHHLVVLSTMAALALAEPNFGFLLLAAVPCIVGGIHALALRAAGHLPGPAVLHADPP